MCADIFVDLIYLKVLLILRNSSNKLSDEYDIWRFDIRKNQTANLFHICLNFVYDLAVLMVFRPKWKHRFDFDICQNENTFFISQKKLHLHGALNPLKLKTINDCILWWLFGWFLFSRIELLGFALDFDES